MATYNDAKRRVYGKNLAKKQKCSVPCSVLFSSRYIDEKKIFRQRFVSGSSLFTYLNLLVSIFILFTESNQISRTRSILKII